MMAPTRCSRGWGGAGDAAMGPIRRPPSSASEFGRRNLDQRAMARESRRGRPAAPPLIARARECRPGDFHYTVCDVWLMSAVLFLDIA